MCIRDSLYPVYAVNAGRYKEALDNIRKLLLRLRGYPYIARELHRKLFASHFIDELLKYNAEMLDSRENELYSEQRSRVRDTQDRVVSGEGKRIVTPKKKVMSKKLLEKRAAESEANRAQQIIKIKKKFKMSESEDDGREVPRRTVPAPPAIKKIVKQEKKLLAKDFAMGAEESIPSASSAIREGLKSASRGKAAEAAEKALSKASAGKAEAPKLGQPPYHSDFEYSRSKGLKELEDSRAGKRTMDNKSFLDTSPQQAPASERKAGLDKVYQIFQGSLRYSGQDLANIQMFSCSEIKDIIKCPKIASFGNEELLEVEQQVPLATVSKALDRLRLDPRNHVGIGGWIEVRYSPEGLEKLTKQGKDLFSSGKAFVARITKHASIIILEDYAFQLNYSTLYSHLLGNYREYIQHNYNPKLVYVIVSSEHSVNRDFPRILPEEVELSLIHI
eukprot:TRINITY_DN22357_c0_g1_i1.p1 TRINITY_DN22357_c0_g1~~TRINITY_DN22357_c0_g1_i1.p1  ORF type:complete len:466 (+),score=120.74 TRINITY_DN22357_c0_g1_i1:60-1400(+)